MTTKGLAKYRPPLTREQQATVVQWRGLGIKYMRKALHGRGLGHFEDEAEGLAHVALCEAVRVWVPERGSFPSCLKWWVSSVANKFSAHGARTVQQSEHSAEYVDAWSLNRAPYHFLDSGNPAGTWEDLLVNESVGDPSEPIDSRRLMRAAEVVLPRRVAGGRDGKIAKRNAQLSVQFWVARMLEDTPYEPLGAPHGLSRQAVQQRVARVQRAFEEWAAELREEAA